MTAFSWSADARSAFFSFSLSGISSTFSIPFLPTTDGMLSARPDRPYSPCSSTDTGSTVLPQGSLREFKEGSERAFIVAKLRENAWNISATAQAIDTPRSNLYKKLEQYGITEETDGLTSKAPGA